VGFGERMQREREMRGITLEEIANATKIGARSLRALEQEDFDKLPGGIFNKGFVRAYARYLGIDEDQAVADYLLASGEPQEDSGGESERLQKLGSNWKATSFPTLSGSPFGVPWRGLAVLALLAAVVFSAVRYRGAALATARRWLPRHHASATVAAPQNNPALPAAPGATIPQGELTAMAQASPSPLPSVSPLPDRQADAVSPAAPEAVPAPTSHMASDAAVSGSEQESVKADSQLEADQASESNGSELVLVIRARQDSWLKVTADGKPVLNGVLTANRQKAVRARQKITVLAGNAGGIDLYFNGKPQPPLGTDKQVRTVTFTREGMQD